MSQLIERAVVKPLRWSSSRVFGHHKMRGSSPFGEWDAFDIEDMSEAQIDARKAEAQRRYEASFLAGVEPASPSPVAAGGYVLVPVEQFRGEVLWALRQGARIGATPDELAKTILDCPAIAARPPIGETVPGAGNGEVKP